MSDAGWSRVQESLKTYDFATTRATPLSKRTYRLEGPTRMYNVRVLPASEAGWRMSVADGAAAGGCMRVERALKNRYAERILPMDDGAVLYVSQHWDGEPLSVNLADVRASGVALGALHTALQASIKDGMLKPDQIFGETQSRNGTWLQSFNRGRQLFDTERSLAQSRLGPDKGSAWRELLGNCTELANAAIHVLENAGYRAWAAAAEVHESVAWNGVGTQSFTRLPSGAIAISQTHAPVRDTALYDVACLAEELVRSGTSDAVDVFLNAYQTRHPLSDEECQIVRGFAVFPHTALRGIRAVQRQRADAFEAASQVIAQQLDAAKTLLKKMN